MNILKLPNVGMSNLYVYLNMSLSILKIDFFSVNQPVADQKTDPIFECMIIEEYAFEDLIIEKTI